MTIGELEDARGEAERLRETLHGLYQDEGSGLRLRLDLEAAHNVADNIVSLLNQAIRRMR